MSHVDAKPLGGKIFTKPVILLLIGASVGIYFLTVRYAHGIGAVSHLSDYMPWGIWKVLNVIVGAALVCGGFVGLVNGVVIARFRINALITTLATMQIVRGLAKNGCSFFK